MLFSITEFRGKKFICLPRSGRKQSKWSGVGRICGQLDVTCQRPLNLISMIIATFKFSRKDINRNFYVKVSLCVIYRKLKACLTSWSKFELPGFVWLFTQAPKAIPNLDWLIDRLIKSTAKLIIALKKQQKHKEQFSKFRLYKYEKLLH